MRRSACLLLLLAMLIWQPRRVVWLPLIGPITTHRAAAHDLSPQLRFLRSPAAPSLVDCGKNCGESSGDPDADDDQAPGTPPREPPVTPAAAAIEQRTQGSRPAAREIVTFDGLGVGFDGPQGQAIGRNPSDNSLAVGRDRIVQLVNSRLAVFSKSGEVLYGAVPTHTIFSGFGGPCEEREDGDAVVRYDQLADRWLIVMPILNRIVGRPEEPYAVCYAVSEDSDPMGRFYRYEFRRKLFPDYPRVALWPDGYYVATSTGDNVIQKHACVADRSNMLKGRDASEQCVVVEGVNFLNNIDLDGPSLPPTDAPNIVMAAGGSQLRQILQDDAVYAWQFRVSWSDPAKTTLGEPLKIPVAQYHYLCGGRLTKCVPQPATAVRLDAQGDKIMQRLAYRNFGDHESIVALHSVDTAAGGGGIRWYEFRLNAKRDPVVYQQGTYAPDAFYRWMASAAMDRAGNLAIGYSFGGGPNFAGQRFTARLAGDPLAKLTLHEATLAAGAAAQTDDSRWEDFTTTSIDPADDCTFWYVGDYYRAGATAYSTRIGAYRLPGCLQQRVNGIVFFDRNHDGRRDPGEVGVGGVTVSYAGAKSGTVVTGTNGNYNLSLPADPAYQSLRYRLSARESAVTVSLDESADIDFATVCTVPNRGGAGADFWRGATGMAILKTHDGVWQKLLHDTAGIDVSNSDELTTDLAATALNIAYGSQDGDITVHDPVAGDWPTLRELLARVPRSPAYLPFLRALNSNRLAVTPSKASGCPAF